MRSVAVLRWCTRTTCRARGRAPRPRLRRRGPADFDRVAPKKIALFVRRPLRQEAGGHLDLDVTGDSPVHGADLWLVYRRTSELTVLATRNQLPALKRPRLRLRPLHAVAWRRLR